MKTGRKVTLIIGNLLVILSLVFIAVALFGNAKQGEANIGDFGTEYFNDNWHISWDGKEQVVSLPALLDDCKDTTVIMENVLPDNITDGMRLCMRSALQELRFYINGELRGEYSGDDMPYAGTHLPSSYVLVDLEEADAGATISIHVKISDRSKLNEISLGYGNNVWFSLLSENLPVVVAAFLLIAVGCVVIVFYFILRKRLHFSRAIFFLSQTIIIVGLWILSESHIRQLIFRSPSYSGIFAYLLIEALGGFVAMYFDEVQKHKYEKAYLAIQILVFGQAIVNILLAATGVAEFYSTIIISHIWLICGLCIFIVTMVIDIRSKRVNQYRITAMGMVTFLVFCIFEMLEYYLTDFHILGVYLCVGLLILLASTIIQAVTEEFERMRVTIEKEKFQAELEKKVDEQTLELRVQQQKISELFVETVTALSEAVDAKDRYTSGHSKRVAEYARMIAGRMGKNEAEQEEIYRAGLLHDVGKIRIPAEIINKTGKLTDEEYNTIKIHPVTGYHILKGVAGNSHIAIAAKYHHERYDGRGYPNGIAGENIPEIARILGVADAYDAMASDRSYRKAMPQDIIRSELVKGRGTQFDPAIADIMIQMVDEDTHYILKQPEASKHNILVVSDDAEVHSRIAGTMNDEPMYDVITAEDGISALDILNRQSIDIILLDMDITDTNIPDFIHSLRENHSAPIVLITENQKQSLSTDFEQLDCEDYISKQFVPLMLLEIIHTLTEKSNY